MTRSLIVAVSENGVIGSKNQLPWSLPDDLKHFKRITMGHTLIMGRRTFESIGRALPGRHSIVVSRNPKYAADGVTAVTSLEHAFAAAGSTDVFVIGGASVYEEALPLIDRVYLTRVHTTVDGDVYFPPLDHSIWKISERTAHERDTRHAHAFAIERYDRITPLPPILDDPKSIA